METAWSMGRSNSLFQAHPQGIAFDIRHHEVQEAVSLAGIEQGENVGVGQLGRDPDLGEEPLPAERRREILEQHLDGHVTVVLEIAGQEDGGHAAVPDFPIYGVVASQGTLEALESFGHGFSIWTQTGRSTTGGQGRGPDAEGHGG